MTKGTPEIKSIGTMTFGPEGILFVADPQSTTIFAVGTGDTKGAAAPKEGLKVANVNEKVASLLGIESGQLAVRDLVVNPASSTAYVGVMRGRGTDAAPVIVRIDGSGKLSEFGLKDVPFSKVAIPNAKGTQRAPAITCMAYLKDKLFVAGLSNEEFASTFWTMPFPFKEADKGAGVQIFHGNHGRLETNAPIRTFTPLEVKGETNLLAAYTCTPLVQIPVGELKAGARVKGKTVAELGNQNTPLDMVVYEKDGKQYVLMANDRRGVMKISTEGIDTIEAITKRVGGIAGLKYDTISDLKGVKQLARLNDKQALVIVQTEKDGPMSIETIALP